MSSESASRNTPSEEILNEKVSFVTSFVLPLAALLMQSNAIVIACCELLLDIPFFILFLFHSFRLIFVPVVGHLSIQCNRQDGIRFGRRCHRFGHLIQT